jgi:hypothetical protein
LFCLPFKGNETRRASLIELSLTPVFQNKSLGEFSIIANAKDSLIFFYKDYFFKRIKLTQNDLDKNNLLIDMIVKPEELDEVVIHKINFPHVDPARESLSTNSSNPLQKYTGVYDGTTNGINFIAVGQQIFDLFKKEKEKPKKKTLEIDFKKLVATSIPNDFFTKDLKLNSDEVDLFLEYCDADPRSKRLLENSNILTTLDFLYAKNEGFQKLKTEPKN